METVKSLAWIPFGLVLVAGVAFVVVVLVKVVLPGRRKQDASDDQD